MVELVLPNRDGKSTKDLIINILSQDFPLSIMKLYNSLRRKHGVNVSYQAVHKLVKELVLQGVLVRRDKKYFINLEWVRGLHNFSKQVEKKYSELEPSIEEIVNSQKNSITLTFENLLELDKFVMQVHDYFYPRLDRDDVVCMHFKHQWWHLIYPRKDYPSRKNNSKFYMLCAGKTLLDKQGNEFKRKAGFNVVIAPCAHNCDTSVWKDLVIDIYYEPELGRAMDLEFRKVKKIEQLNPPELIRRVFKKKSRIVVVINKNKEIADNIKTQTLDYFKQGTS